MPPTACRRSSLWGSRRPTPATAGVLELLYDFVFMALQLHEYALLVGSLRLVIMLAALMFLSHNTN
jgi:inner membrane protein